jgi:hypothetical protein
MLCGLPARRVGSTAGVWHGELCGPVGVAAGALLLMVEQYDSRLVMAAEGQCTQRGFPTQVLWRFWDDADSEAGLRHNLAREERANVGIAATVS